MNNQIKPYIDLLIPLPEQLVNGQLPCVIAHEGSPRWYKPAPFQPVTVHIDPHSSETDTTLASLAVFCTHYSLGDDCFDLCLLNTAHLPFATYTFYADCSGPTTVYLSQPADLIPYLRLLLSHPCPIKVLLDTKQSQPRIDDNLLFWFFFSFALALHQVRAAWWLRDLDFFIDLLHPLCDQLVTGQLRCDILHSGLAKWPQEDPENEGILIYPEPQLYKPKSFKITDVHVYPATSQTDIVTRRIVVQCYHSYYYSDELRVSLYNAADQIFLQYEFSPVPNRPASLCVLQPCDLAVYLRLLHEDFYQYRQIYYRLYQQCPETINPYWREVLLLDVDNREFTDEHPQLFFIVLSLALAYGRPQRSAVEEEFRRLFPLLNSLDDDEPTPPSRPKPPKKKF